MNNEQPNNPLHGVSLKAILESLVARHGWEELGRRVRVRCFNENPSLSSSLKFLRKTDWARTKVERIYLEDQRLVARNRKRNQRRADMRAFRAACEAGEAGLVQEATEAKEGHEEDDSTEQSPTSTRDDEQR